MFQVLAVKAVKKGTCHEVLRQAKEHYYLEKLLSWGFFFGFHSLLDVSQHIFATAPRKISPFLALWVSTRSQTTVDTPVGWANFLWHPSSGLPPCSDLSFYFHSVHKLITKHRDPSGHIM
jgi:hypothetical protein